ncbi:MAG: FG-GAP-like repeat-containing protein [Marinibacterium sp.]|nr:FG-GAP-like repeat-containing protein [Marinibacterium sp.]
MISRARRRARHPLPGSARRAWLLLALVASGWGTAAVAQISGAAFEQPTTRYPHGVLGDAIEYAALRVDGPDGSATFELPRDLVFEDLAPRLWDVDGDGAPEVVVVESHVHKGARLAIYGSRGRLAATPFIGTRFRWLAPVGAADLDGDGHTEIAYIDRPHLARILRIWRFRDGGLEPVAQAGGLSNHRIGEDFISGGVRDCGAGLELITADGTWSQIMSSRLVGGRIEIAALGPLRSASDFDDALRCR